MQGHFKTKPIPYAHRRREERVNLRKQRKEEVLRRKRSTTSLVVPETLPPAERSVLQTVASANLDDILQQNPEICRQSIQIAWKHRLWDFLLLVSAHMPALSDEEMYGPSRDRWSKLMVNEINMEELLLILEDQETAQNVVGNLIQDGALKNVDFGRLVQAQAWYPCACVLQTDRHRPASHFVPFLEQQAPWHSIHGAWMLQGLTIREENEQVHTWVVEAVRMDNIEAEWLVPILQALHNVLYWKYQDCAAFVSACLDHSSAAVQGHALELLESFPGHADRVMRIFVTSTFRLQCTAARVLAQMNITAMNDAMGRALHAIRNDSSALVLLKSLPSTQVVEWAHEYNWTSVWMDWPDDQADDLLDLLQVQEEHEPLPTPIRTMGRGRGRVVPAWMSQQQ